MIATGLGFIPETSDRDRDAANKPLLVGLLALNIGTYR